MESVRVAGKWPGGKRAAENKKFNAQPGAHFLIERMFEENRGMHYGFSCEAACDASIKILIVQAGDVGCDGIRGAHVFK